jgi:AhpD family alkylhydroperoxidase
MPEDDYAFPWEKAVEDVAPGLHAAESAWLGAIDSLTALDRKTHELIRLVCTAILRNEPGLERHARLATEAGASWDEIVCALLLTQPAFGVLPMAEGLPAARKGFETASVTEADE